jgi:hypothetical protein
MTQYSKFINMSSITTVKTCYLIYVFSDSHVVANLRVLN